MKTFWQEKGFKASFINLGMFDREGLKFEVLIGVRSL